MSSSGSAGVGSGGGMLAGRELDTVRTYLRENDIDVGTSVVMRDHGWPYYGYVTAHNVEQQDIAVTIYGEWQQLPTGGQSDAVYLVGYDEILADPSNIESDTQLKERGINSPEALDELIEGERAAYKARHGFT